MHKILQTLNAHPHPGLKLIRCLIIPAVLLPPSAAAERIRIASWNIADFHHQVGVEARENIGTRRYPADFRLLQEYAAKIDADIVALQEIVTEQAARLLFPASDYWLFMSSRYRNDKAAGTGPDIYTALAVRRDSGIQPLRQNDLRSLQIDPAGDSRYEKPTRRGTAVLLEIAGESVWVMSVHLKSSCAKVKKISRSRQHACKVLWRQSRRLKQWIDERLLDNEHFVIAGDFNRRFGRLKDQGGMWKLLSRRPVDSSRDQAAQRGGAEPVIRRFPGSKLRRCPTRKGKDVHPIDWFVVSTDFAGHFLPESYFETRWSRDESRQHRNRLSDHCPIHIEFSTPQRR